MPWLLRNAHKTYRLDFWYGSQGLFIRLDFCHDLTRLTDLTFGMAHKACSFALTFAMTSQDLRRHYHFRSDFCLGSQGLYVHLDFCHDSQNWLISKSPWLASGWSLMTSDLGECLLMLISTLPLSEGGILCNSKFASKECKLRQLQWLGQDISYLIICCNVL
jgi:hypothetical protein